MADDTTEQSGQHEHIATRDVLASVLLLFATAIALPLLDLLGRNAAFFVVRDSPTIDIIALGLLVTFGVPLLLSIIAVLAGRIHPRAGAVIHGIIFIALGGVLALSVIRQTSLGTRAGWLQIILAGATSVVFYVAYMRIPTLRWGVRWTWIVPFAVLGLFLFASPASQLVFGSERQATAGPVEVGNPAPVVFVVFDALSVSDLMDGDGNLQKELYPNFARLAANGTWYRNAITVHHGTERSVPAILSGLVSSQDEVPLLSDHPDNLFTLLDDLYDINAAEPITELCPVEECQEQSETPVSAMGRWRGLTSDLRIVAGHLFLPEDLVRDLPPVDETWGGFDNASAALGDEASDETSREFDVRVEFRAALAQDRRKSINTFVNSIDAPQDRPTLHFLHALIPHSPWSYLPTGQLSDLPEARLVSRNLPEGYVNDPWRIEQVHQLHLIQVQYADTVLGSILDRLESLGIYQDSLIVVVADHGETFRPGMPRLRGFKAVAEDVLPIPLFIKAPHQTEAAIDDYRALTIDVLPTVADILDADVPWETDGTSLASTDRPQRGNSSVTVADGTIDFPSDNSVARALAEQRIERFGLEGPFGLAPTGFADLLGEPVANLEIGDPTEMQLALRDPERWEDVDTSSGTLPVSIRGRLDGSNSSENIIAIALNGDIVAVTRSYLDANDATHFDAMLPPEALSDGRNELQVFLVSDLAGTRSLNPFG